MDELEELRRDYLDEVRETIALIRRHGRGLADGGNFKTSFPALLFLAHQLKGSGGSLGFPGITEVAKRMGSELDRFLDEEQASRPSPSQLGEALDAIANELEREVTIGAAR